MTLFAGDFFISISSQCYTKILENCATWSSADVDASFTIFSSRKCGEEHRRVMEMVSMNRRLCLGILSLWNTEVNLTRLGIITDYNNKPNLFHRDRQNSTEIFVWPLLMQCILAIAVCWHCLMLSEQVSTDADVRISGWIPAISKTLSNCLAQEHLHYITWYTDTNTILTLKNMMNDQMNTNDLEKQ